MRHKILSLMCCALMAASWPAAAVPGDADRDGVVGLPDVVRLLRSAGGMSAGLAPEAMADVDLAADAFCVPDGRLDLLDAVRILRSIHHLDDLSLWPPPLLPLADTLTVTGDTEKDFALRNGVWVTGKVTLGGEPPQDAIMTWYDSAGSPISYYQVIQGPEGTFRAAVKPDTYRVVVDCALWGLGGFFSISWAWPEEVTVTGPDRVEFHLPSLPAGVVASVLVNSPDFQPNSNWLYAMDVSAEGATDSFMCASGDLFLAQVTPGRYRLSLSGPANADATVSVHAILAAKPLTVTREGPNAFEVRLPKMADLSGTLTLPPGIRATYFYGATEGAGLATDSSQSSQTLSGPNYRVIVPPGEYRLSASLDPVETEQGRVSPSYHWTKTVPPGQTVHPLVVPPLPAMHRVRGRVTDAGGRPVDQVQIYFSPLTSPAGEGYQTNAGAITDSEGRYEVLLLPNEYRVNTTPPSR